MATSRDPDRVADTAAALRDLGARTAAASCDVTDADSVAACRDAAVEAMGGVDRLTCCPARQAL